MAFGSHLEGDSLRATLDSAECTPERRFDVWISSFCWSMESIDSKENVRFIFELWVSGVVVVLIVPSSSYAVEDGCLS